jgi:hypothetical protein
VAWIGPSEKSRVVAIQPGHGKEAHENANCRRLVRNAIVWATAKRHMAISLSPICKCKSTRAPGYRKSDNHRAAAYAQMGGHPPPSSTDFPERQRTVCGA